MKTPRKVIMLVDAGLPPSTARQVEFLLDEDFLERLRQLRSLVPAVTTLSEKRDLVIDRVRARLPSAIWRVGQGPRVLMERSNIVVAPGGVFCCAARVPVSREHWQTPNASITRLFELHSDLAPGAPLCVFSEPS